MSLESVHDMSSYSLSHVGVEQPITNLLFFFLEIFDLPCENTLLGLLGAEQAAVEESSCLVHYLRILVGTALN